MNIFFIDLILFFYGLLFMYVLFFYIYFIVGGIF